MFAQVAVTTAPAWTAVGAALRLTAGVAVAVPVAVGVAGAVAEGVRVLVAVGVLVAGGVAVDVLVALAVEVGVAESATTLKPLLTARRLEAIVAEQPQLVS